MLVKNIRNTLLIYYCINNEEIWKYRSFFFFIFIFMYKKPLLSQLLPTSILAKFDCKFWIYVLFVTVNRPSYWRMSSMICNKSRSPSDDLSFLKTGDFCDYVINIFWVFPYTITISDFFVFCKIWINLDSVRQKCDFSNTVSSFVIMMFFLCLCI